MDTLVLKNLFMLTLLLLLDFVGLLVAHAMTWSKYCCSVSTAYKHRL